jgi:NAD(P)-dependent dehydrogenase (short-subunit alcohol dehydrogenase family)
MPGEFAGKVVVITGAAGGLGSAVTRRFAAEGARLVLVERSAEKLARIAAEVGGDVLTIPADLSDAAAVERVVTQTEARFGQIDALAHTVGGFEAGAKVYDSGYDALERMFALNTRPVYLTAGRVARHMVEQNIPGRIVVVLARGGLKGFSGGAAYTASKAAAQRVIESLSAEVRDKRIHVNAVLPSTIDTPANRADMPNADFSKWVTPDDVASAILFLASERGNAFYGASLEVYGRA